MVTLQKHYQRIRDWGAVILAITVDTPEESEKFRREEDIEFDILADKERKVIGEWNILNSKERGGIPYPNVYILEKNGEIIYHSADRLASRADPGAILKFMDKYDEDPSHRMKNEARKVAWPTFKNLMLALPKKLGWM